MLTELHYFLFNGISEESYEVNETEFFEVVGFDRNMVPMKYDTDNQNKRNFFFNDELIGFTIRTIKQNYND